MFEPSVLRQRLVRALPVSSGAYFASATRSRSEVKVLRSTVGDRVEVSDHVF
jgi:hypothetical protein